MITVAAAALLLVAAGLYFVFSSGDGSSADDDRPPIIVNNGSVYIWGGDNLKDPDSIKDHWKNWIKDSKGTKWMPDLPHGKKVDHFEVSVTTSGQACPSMSGNEIHIEYTHTDGQTPPPPVTFTFTAEPNDKGKMEPKVDTGNVEVSQTDVDRPNNFPAKLSYDKNGYISNLTVFQKLMIAPVGSCPFKKADNPIIRIDPKPIPKT
jgi:hypothetical protein